MTTEQCGQDQLPIGLFDSGVGGLTVLDAMRRLMPGEDYLFLGDTARVPYGAKSQKTIVRYSLQAAAKLIGQRCWSSPATRPPPPRFPPCAKHGPTCPSSA